MRERCIGYELASLCLLPLKSSSFGSPFFRRNVDAVGEFYNIHRFTPVGACWFIYVLPSCIRKTESEAFGRKYILSP